MPQKFGDSLRCAVNPNEFAKMAATFGEVNWRPMEGSSAPGWPAYKMPPGPHLAVLRDVFRERGAEFYGAIARLGLLGGIFDHREQLHDFISEIDGRILVSEALLRAVAVCPIVPCGDAEFFDIAELITYARSFTQRKVGNK